MSYFGFLGRFVGIPILFLLLAYGWDRKNGKRPFAYMNNLAFWLVLAIHILLAFTYTTPWDNYLVATGVWWYNPELVTGIVFGWVPIEEYTFFVVQPIMTGLWLLWLISGRVGRSEKGEMGAGNGRYWVLLGMGISWIILFLIWLSAWDDATYLSLQLTWALIPLMIQVGFGGDILWRYRWVLFWGIVPPTLYLAGADSLAIDAGTWTIDPEQTLGWLWGGILPFEEFLFFFLTNVMLVWGMVLALAEESKERFDSWRAFMTLNG